MAKDHSIAVFQFHFLLQGDTVSYVLIISCDGVATIKALFAKATSFLNLKLPICSIVLTENHDSHAGALPVGVVL